MSTTRLAAFLIVVLFVGGGPTGCSSEKEKKSAVVAEPEAKTSVREIPASPEAVEKEFLTAVARGDLDEVKEFATHLDLTKVTNLYSNVWSSPNADVIKFIRDKAGFYISDLQIAARCGDVLAVDQLLANLSTEQRSTALADGDSPFSSTSPLRLAVWNGHIAVVRKLIHYGANVNEVSRYTLSPLANAAEGGNVEMLKLLLDSGADVNTQANDWYTALMRACIGGRPATAKILLEAGANPNLQRHDGRSALHFSALHGDAECVKLLLEYHADINAIAYG